MNSKESSIFRVRLSRRAENYIRRADRNTQQRIGQAIEFIRKQPLRGPKIKELKGREGEYRYYLFLA
jgi:mRNA-degrading endonuclease RelE of RelBE toxin-antitoxin system